MSAYEKAFAACLILLGFSTLLCIVALLVSDWRDRRKAKSDLVATAVGGAEGDQSNAAGGSDA